MANEQPEEPGWYAVKDNEGRVQYWDGAEWHDPGDENSSDEVRESREVYLFQRANAAEDAIKRTGAREGEGIPFHELYMRRLSTKKRDWHD